MAPSSSSAACPEKRLLVLCARTQMPPSLAEEICRIAGGPLDWDFLLHEAAENSVTPLLARHLPVCAPEMPAAVREALEAAARAIVGRSLILTAELIGLLDVLRHAGILAIPYKGPVLAAQAYGDITLREFDDLDIILRQRDIPAAHKAMCDLGFRTESLGRFSAADSPVIPGEYSYRDEARQLIVELHTERTLRHFPIAPDLDRLEPTLVPVALSGHQVRTFPAEEGLTFLSVHGSKDLWERLSWVVDIAELVHAHPDLDWDAAFRFAQSLRAGRMLHLGLLLADGLLDARLSATVAARIHADQEAEALAKRFEQRLLSRVWKPMGSAARFDLRRRMLAGTSAGWAYSLRLALAPAQDDWAELHLPKTLLPLYFLVRPFRLLRKYGVRSS